MSRRRCAGRRRGLSRRAWSSAWSRGSTFPASLASASRTSWRWNPRDRGCSRARRGSRSSSADVDVSAVAFDKSRVSHLGAFRGVASPINRLMARRKHVGGCSGRRIHRFIGHTTPETAVERETGEISQGMVASREKWRLPYPLRRTASVKYTGATHLISTGDVKKGIIIELDGQLMKVLDWTHIKMARGSAQVRMKMQNVRKGDIVERTFQAGTRWPRARVEQRRVQYLYSDGETYHFMDNETYDQFTVAGAMLGDDARYLVENTEVFVSSHENEILGVDLPVTVDLRVTQTDPGFAGDTATGAKKAATVETGLVVQVPLFVNEGDMLRIDTRNGEYVTRVQ